MRKQYLIRLGFGWFVVVPRWAYNWLTSKTPITGMVVMIRE